MGIIHPSRRRFALIPLAVGLSASLAIGWIIWRTSLERITPPALLREAVAEWNAAGEPGDGPTVQIFEQQATQGYYSDAQATARLFKRADDRDWAVVELAKIRTENGDVLGAKSRIRSLGTSPLATKAAEEVALVQAHNGDAQGALETIGRGGDAEQVLMTFGRHQIETGDFDGALRTAEQMPHSGYQLFYVLGDELRSRNEGKRVRELASHISDRKQAALFTQIVRFTLRPIEIQTQTMIIAGPCEVADHDAAIGNFVEADSLIEQNKCPYVSFVTTRQYVVDPQGAERLLRREAESKDLALGLAELAPLAANRGDIAGALRLLDDVQRVIGAESVWGVVHEIARAWTIRKGPKPVVKWARSRPNAEQRTWALLGIAEALGHPRPNRVVQSGDSGPQTN